MDKSQENKLAIKSGIWYTLANFLVRAMSFITTPIFARLLSTDEYGDFNNFLSWQSVALIVIPLNLEASLLTARFDYKEELEEYKKSILTLSMLSSIIWTALILILHDYVADLFSMNFLYMIGLLVFVASTPAINIYQMCERFEYRYKNSVIMGLVISIGSSLLALLLVMNMTDRLEGRIIGALAPTILIGLVLSVKYLITTKLITKYWKYACKICIPYIPHLLSLTLLNVMDRIMIRKMCGATDNAMYSMAYNCGAIITMLITSMNGAFSPWLGNRLHNKEYKETRDFSKKYIWAFTLMAVTIELIAPEILYILGGDTYVTAKHVMVPVALGSFCQFLYTLFVNVEQLEKKTTYMAWASMSAALLNYVLNLWLIPKYGYLAAAYTTLAGYLWLLIVHMLIVRLIGYRKVYDYGFIIKTASVVMIVSGVIHYLYTNSPLRYIFVAVYVLTIGYFALRYKDRIIGYIKNFKNASGKKE